MTTMVDRATIAVLLMRGATSRPVVVRREQTIDIEKQNEIEIKSIEVKKTFGD